MKKGPKQKYTCESRSKNKRKQNQGFVKCTPPQIEGFTWSRHLFNFKGKIRKPSIKNTSVVLMYIKIYIKFYNKKLQCFFVLDTI